MNSSKNRLIGGLPKIGIRPIIDGRLGGVRESLESITMKMAENVANFYSSNLRHSDGTKVECVIADTCIGGVPVTMSRINLVKGIGPVLQIAEGTTVELPEKVNHILTERTNPTWPTTWFAPRLTGNGAFKDVYSVMANWGPTTVHLLMVTLDPN